jgi:hypothetical protein
MKIKQVLLIVGISAVSSVGSLALYNHFSSKDVIVGSAQNGLPVNYAGFFDGKAWILQKPQTLLFRRWYI